MQDACRNKQPICVNVKGVVSKVPGTEESDAFDIALIIIN